MNSTAGTKHTPGPWTVETVHTEHGYTLQIQGDRQGASAVIVADMPLFWASLPQANHATWERMEANARVLAAAPDLLAVCEAALLAIDRKAPNATETPELTAVHNALAAAIARATGKDA